MRKKAELPKFDPDVYTKIAPNDLLVYSIHHLHMQGSGITSEDVISACFTLFPKKFSLRKHPRWPDSAMVSRRWSDCRARGYIAGNAVHGFRLTSKGSRLAERIARVLGVAASEHATKIHSPIKKKRSKPAPGRPEVVKRVHVTRIKKMRRVKRVRKTVPVRKEKVTAPSLVRPPIHTGKLPLSPTVERPRTAQPPSPVHAAPAEKSRPAQSHVLKEMRMRAGKFVRVIEKSDAYVHYRRNGHRSRIGEFDFRSMLLCTMESSPETLARNVDLYKKYAGIKDRQDLVEFLVFCERYFSALLTPRAGTSVKRAQSFKR